jgi:hypothetical protein
VGKAKRLSRYCEPCETEAAETQAMKKKEQDARYYRENYDRIRSQLNWAHIKRRYGITRDQYEEMFDAQNHCCAICHRHANEFKQALHVDHNHETGQVRGLLCFPCNTRLGVLENTDWRAEAESYLSSWVREL